MNIKTTKTFDAVLASLDPNVAALVIAAMEEALDLEMNHEVPKAIRQILDSQPAKLHIGITAANIWEMYGLPPSKRGPQMLGRLLTEQNAHFGEAKVGTKWIRIYEPKLVIQSMNLGGLLEHCKKYISNPSVRRTSKRCNVVQLRPQSTKSKGSK